MGSPQQAMPFRLAHSSLQLALRFWPEETRDWGHALAAELDEIEKPLVALQWAFGGLMLFSRASASHFLAWLKLPAGSRLSTAPLLPGTSVPILPKRSRLFTAVILLAAALLLFLPQSRQAISTVVASWNGYEISSGDRRTLANLAAQAEKDKDGRTLAFVALVLRDPEQGMRLADKAVVLDPQLTWVYASRFYRPADVQQPTEWLVRLHASDPDNSVTDLLIADNIAQPRYMALMALGTPGLQQFESQITGDPRWVAHMEAAFRAPRYDGYVTKHWELISYVWSSHPTLSPSIIGYELWAHRIPNLSNLMSFANFKIRRAQQALAEGHPEEAEQILRQIDAFGNLMTDRAQTDIECLIGLDLSRKAARELGAHYAATGQEAAASFRARRASENAPADFSPSVDGGVPDDSKSVSRKRSPLSGGHRITASLGSYGGFQSSRDRASASLLVPSPTGLATYAVPRGGLLPCVAPLRLRWVCTEFSSLCAPFC
jgi:hypothetical protein